MQVKIEPIKPSGTVSAIASKSDAHRAIICAALADKKTNIYISHISNDIEATLNCIKGIGADFTKKNNAYVITPVNPPLQNPILDCNESGSTLRFLLPVISALGSGATFIGSGRLPERPMGLIVDLLKEHGNTFSSSKLPITVSGKTKGGIFTIAGNVSSQFISGLLFALPLLKDDSIIKLSSSLQSAAYVNMTVCTLKRFGVNIKQSEREFVINQKDSYTSPKEYVVEGDWSNAAFFMVLGAIGGKVTIKNLNLNSKQSDKILLEVLSLAGVNYTISNDEITVEKSEIKPFSFDVSGCPDLFPILSVLACGAKGKSTLYNAERLRIKESDRIKTTKELILKLGGKAEEASDSLTVYGSGKLSGGTVESFNDHRIAMSAFAASAICENEVILKDAKAIDKSYPSFIEDFISIGGKVNVITDR